MVDRKNSPMRGSMSALAVTVALACAPVAQAAVVSFSGTQMNTDAPSGPSAARCGAQITVNIGNGPGATSTGVSNYGTFLSTQSHCISPPLPTSYDQGLFQYDFASGATLLGTYTGVLTFNSPGLSNNLQNFTVTGGTGQFAGATGAFTGIGVVDFRGPTPTAQLRFNGTLDAPAIPEPSTWAMFILGFGLVGALVRQRSHRALVV